MSETISPNDKTDTMEALQPKPMPQTPVPANPYTPQAPMAGGMAPQQMMGERRGRESEETSTQDGATVRFAITKLSEYLQWFLMVLEAMLGLRFLLKILGADPSGIFANFIFSLTQVLLVPFQGTAPTVPLGTYTHTFEFSTLFAAAIYFLLFYALRRFLNIATTNSGE